MRFLVSNDDGWQAPGLDALVQVLSPWGEVVVIAPSQELSGCSHQTTTHSPLQVKQVRPGYYSVEGTPADCVRLGLLHLAPDTDWVLSGINNGGNLGVDVFMSGTVAAAREAAFLGRPAIALSQYRRSQNPIDWSAAIAGVRVVVERLLERPLPGGAFWNVNFPDADHETGSGKIVDCPLEAAPLPVHFQIENECYLYKTNYHERPRKPGSDVDVCFSGNIAVTQLVAME